MPFGSPACVARRWSTTGPASMKVISPSSSTAAIMNTMPPKLVGIWAAFSLSNCG